jgi:hypothetical protein
MLKIVLSQVFCCEGHILAAPENSLRTARWHAAQTAASKGRVCTQKTSLASAKLYTDFQSSLKVVRSMRKHGQIIGCTHDRYEKSIQTFGRKNSGSKEEH